jgi:small conductance mechanosensitive channel
MNKEFLKLQELGKLMRDHGLELLIAMIILVVGLFLTKWAVKNLKNILARFMKNTEMISIISNCIGIILLTIILVAVAVEVGAKPRPIIELLMLIVLGAIGIIVIFRPLIPTLPFKVGDTVKIGDLLGKIEATTILHTRLKTFDGKTFFVPNRKIIDDIVINYQFTKTRRIKVDVSIRFDQDLARAKQILEAIMTADPRVLTKPSPQVYVLKLTPDGVEVGGRCWVNNANYWVGKCELLEKTKFRFDNEGIQFAYPQLGVHFYKRGGFSDSL